MYRYLCGPCQNRMVKIPPIGTPDFRIGRWKSAGNFCVRVGVFTLVEFLLEVTFYFLNASLHFLTRSDNSAGTASSVPAGHGQVYATCFAIRLHPRLNVTAFVSRHQNAAPSRTTKTANTTIESAEKLKREEQIKLRSKTKS